MVEYFAKYLLTHRELEWHVNKYGFKLSADKTCRVIEGEDRISALRNALLLEGEVRRQEKAFSITLEGIYNMGERVF